MSRRERRSYTSEFKAEAVALVGHAGRTVGKVAKELNLTESSLRNWVKNAAQPSTEAPSESEELLRLRQEVCHLRMERDFLKKAAAFFARENR